MPRLIDTWNVFISGFTENRSQKTGLGKAWFDATTHTNSPTTCNRGPMVWNSNWRFEARHIQNYCVRNGVAPKINIFAYSWGAGYGAMELARQLWTAGNFRVDTMVLADPVYYDTRWWMRWNTISNKREWMRRFWPQHKIRVPGNVDIVIWTRQRNNWPRAMSLNGRDSTVINPPHIEDGLIHAEMDESEWFQERVRATWEL